MKVSTILERLDECEETANDIWFNRKKFSVKHEDRLRIKIRNIHFTQELLLITLWEKYRKKKDTGCIDKVDKQEWCDGEWHFKLNKEGDLRYGFRCNC